MVDVRTPHAPASLGETFFLCSTSAYYGYFPAVNPANLSKVRCLERDYSYILDLTEYGLRCTRTYYV